MEFTRMSSCLHSNVMKSFCEVCALPSSAKFHASGAQSMIDTCSCILVKV